MQNPVNTRKIMKINSELPSSRKKREARNSFPSKFHTEDEAWINLLLEEEDRYGLTGSNK
jgi:hypothetical protein